MVVFIYDKGKSVLLLELFAVKVTLSCWI